MNRKLVLLLAIGLAGLACFILYKVLGGATVDEQGVLREPFYLIPIGYFLMFSGFGGALVLLAWRGVDGWRVKSRAR